MPAPPTHLEVEYYLSIYINSRGSKNTTFARRHTLLLHITRERKVQVFRAAMSRPTTSRTASTNLSGGGSGQRILEGRVAIVTGASRGMSWQTHQPMTDPSMVTSNRYRSSNMREPGKQGLLPDHELHFRLVRIHHHRTSRTSSERAWNQDSTRPSRHGQMRPS